MVARHAQASESQSASRATIKRALQADWAERRFSLAYQPQIDLQRRRIVRFEALLRWQRPGSGAISPKTFVPIAEEIGMIDEMGQWVLDQACAEAAAWPEDVGLAVNLSASGLRDPLLPSRIRRASLRSGFAPSRLELELTETAAPMMDERAVRRLFAIQQMGVKITIDDLDVGHASLRHLLDFPFDKIKVDGIYAAALGEPGRRGQAAREIMRSIADLCQRLNIVSLAEGIETERQLAAVMAANFTEVQGFIFGKAAPCEAVPDVLRQTGALWPPPVLQ